MDAEHDVPSARPSHNSGVTGDSGDELSEIPFNIPGSLNVYDVGGTTLRVVPVGNFGSGWTWLVKKADGSVDIVNTGAAGTPLTTADKALLTVDVWEHAYYIDYRNQRPKFVETFFDKLVNWKFAEANFA